MKIYIFDNVDNCSDNYHSDGGIAILANTRTEAEEKYINLAKKLVEKDDYTEDLSGKLVFEADILNEKCYDVDNAYRYDKWNDNMYVFPDAGCC